MILEEYLVAGLIPILSRVSLIKVDIKYMVMKLR